MTVRNMFLPEFNILSLLNVIGLILSSYYIIILTRYFILGIKAYLLPCFGYRQIDFVQKYGSWAVVTGCTCGIGLAYAKELAKRRMNIVLISRNVEKLQKVSQDIESEFSVKTRILCVDFSEGQCVYKRIEQELKSINVGILVNNVGTFIPYPQPVYEVTKELIWNILNVNCGATVAMTRLFLPQMIEKKKGAIVMLGSGVEMQPCPYMAIYAASKVFIRHFTDALRFEYRNKGVTIQLLSPFVINTNMTKVSQFVHKTSLLIPNATTYAQQAVNTLGILDHTTGYWPHSFIYVGNMLLPVTIRTLIEAKMCKIFYEMYKVVEKTESNNLNFKLKKSL